jgi:preprotein translocase subunit YajC
MCGRRSSFAGHMVAPLGSPRKFVALIPTDAAIYLPHQEEPSARFMSNESLKTGDWVRAKSGQTGKIVLISRLSAFVEVRQGETTRTMTFLLSELTKVEPPRER